MKFICRQCKAKYRIADEKLVQRTSSKMKCRKCGHVIDILAVGVPDGAPGDDGGDDDAPPAAGPRDDAPTAPRAEIPESPAERAPVRGGAPPRRPAPKPDVQAEKAAGRAPAAAEPPGRGAQEAPRAQPADGGLPSVFSSGLGGPVTESPAASAVEEWFVGVGGTPLGPIGAARIRELAREGKVTGASLVWKEGFEEWKPVSEFPELSQAVADAAAAGVIVAAPAPATERDEVASGTAAAAPPRAAAPSEAPEELLARVGGASPRRSGTHPAALAAILVALALGVTIGVVVFSKTERVEVVRTIEVPASARAEGDAVAPVAPTVVEEATVEAANGRRPTSGPAAPRVEPSAKPIAGLTGLSGLSGLGPTGASGPDVAAAPAAGGQLDGAAISRVISNFTPSVRRGCWQPALEARTADAPSSARVELTITVAPSGAVEGVRSSGDPRGYPRLGACIESKVRSWKFPRSGGSTTVKVPFVFAAQ